MFFVRKNLVLQRQVNPRTVHQINNRKAILDGDFLSAEVLFGRNRKPGTRFHSGIVGHNHTLPSRHITYTRNNSARRTAAVFGIHTIAHEQANFDKGFVGVYEVSDAVAGGQFALAVLIVNFFLTTAKLGLDSAGLEFVDEGSH